MRSLPRFSPAVLLSGICLTLFLLVALCPTPVRGDTIELLDGQRLNGVIIREDADTVEIQTSGGKLSLRRDRIKTAGHESAGLNELRRAEQSLRRGKSDEALQEVEEAMRAGATPADVWRWCASRQSLLEHGISKDEAGAAAPWALLARRLAGLSIDTSATLPSASSETSFTVPVFEPAAGVTSSPLVVATPTALPVVTSAGELPSKEDLLARGRAIFAAAAAKRAASEAARATSGTATTPQPATEAALPPEQSEFLLAMAQVLESHGERRSAAQLVGRLDTASLGRAMEKQDFVQPLVVELVKDQLDSYDFEAASNLITRMERAGMVGNEACRILLVLRWSSFERRRSEYERAMEVLSQRLAPLSPSLARERMQATLAEAREQLAADDRYEEAVALYEKWGESLTPGTSKELLAALYHDWGKSLLDDKQPDKARAVLEKYLKLAPTGDHSLLDLCDYEKKQLALDPKDYASAFELAQWAAERGLATEAIESYERAAAHPELRAPAQQQIAALQDEIAVAHMGRCMKFYESGDPKRALDELGKFPYLPAARKMTLEIEKLRGLCFAELGRRAALRDVQAQVLLQDAQRRFLMGQGQAAIEELEKVIESYDKTKAADQAREFLNYARTRMEVEQLEGSSASGVTARPQPGIQPQPSTSLEREIKQLLQQLETGKGADGATSVSRTATPPAATDMPTTGPTKSPTPPKDNAPGAVR